jgi:hypothetical protein
MEVWNIAQQYALFFYVKLAEMPPQHMEIFSRLLEIMQCQEHKPFTGTKCFLKAEPWLKMSNALGNNSTDR